MKMDEFKKKFEGAPDDSEVKLTLVSIESDVPSIHVTYDSIKNTVSIDFQIPFAFSRVFSRLG